MPDEVNIDELLELDSEAERSLKIQVGEGERREPPPLPAAQHFTRPETELLELTSLLNTSCTRHQILHKL